MQQVNLFQPAFTTQITLGPDVMLRIVIALALGLALATAWATVAAWWGSISIGRLEGQVSEEITHVAMLAQQLEKHLDTSAFDQRAAGLDTERLAKLQLLRRLRDNQINNLRGFSPHVLAFAKQHVEGMWLTSFSIEAGGTVVSLGGRALRPELVPAFIERLGAEDAYRGLQFRTFALMSPDGAKEPIEFQISNRTRGDISP